MPDIEFTADEKRVLSGRLKQYCGDELGVELGQFDAEFLLDFITQQLGPCFYNKGLQDARTVLAMHLDKVDDALYDIEKPTDLTR